MIKFEKISLDQFTRDYIKCKSYREDSEIGKKEAKEVWENIKLPKRATIDSAGYDFYIPYEQWSSEIEDTLIPTGISWITVDPSTVLLCLP